MNTSVADQKMPDGESLPEALERMTVQRTGEPLHPMPVVTPVCWSATLAWLLGIIGLVFLAIYPTGHPLWRLGTAVAFVWWIGGWIGPMQGRTGYAVLCDKLDRFDLPIFFAWAWSSLLIGVAITRTDGMPQRSSDVEQWLPLSLVAGFLLSFFTLALHSLLLRRKRRQSPQSVAVQRIADMLRLPVGEVRTLTEGVLIHKPASEPLWNTVFCGNEIGNAHRLDMGRVQFGVTTLCIWLIHASQLTASGLAANASPWTPPELPATCLVLMGVSHVFFLCSQWPVRTAVVADAPLAIEGPTQAEQAIADMVQGSRRSEELLRAVERAHSAQLRGTQELLAALTKLVERQSHQQSKSTDALEDVLRDMASRLGSFEQLAQAQERNADQVQRAVNRLEDTARQQKDLTGKLSDFVGKQLRGRGGW